MANPSTPENVQRARDQIERNLETSTEEAQQVRRAADLYRMRRNQMLTSGARMFRSQLAELMEQVTEAVPGGFTAVIEQHTERLFELTQLNDVYGRAKDAIDEGRADAFIASVERQLHHATLNVRMSNAMIPSLMRTYYIAARKKFLHECEPEQVRALTGMDPE